MDEEITSMIESFKLVINKQNESNENNEGSAEHTVMILSNEKSEL